jgi:hypothetical protein
MIHIFEQYPLLKGRIPYVQFGEFPTPIKHLTHLGKEIGTDFDRSHQIENEKRRHR